MSPVQAGGTSGKAWIPFEVLGVRVADNKQSSKAPENRLTLLEEYLYANLLFWGFLVIVGIASFFICGGAWDDVMSGVMEFLFVIIGGGFTLVSALDYAYERYAAKSQPGEKKI